MDDQLNVQLAEMEQNWFFCRDVGMVFFLTYRMNRGVCYADACVIRLAHVL